MRFLNLTLLCFVLNAVSADPALEYLPSSPAKIVKTTTVNPVTTSDVKPLATNIIFQSKDGGQTWQDISDGLPEYEQPEDFFAGESEVYVRVKNGMYRSKSNLNTPVWEKENVPYLREASIAFNRSGVLAFDYGGQIYQKILPEGTWAPIYTNSKKNLMRTIFETADGTLFLGSDNGLYKSADRGKSWKQVQNEGWVMDMVESEGVLIGTGQKGILRSTDHGEHWEWVISEGGVGIAIERIDGGFAAITYSTKTQSRRIRISLDSGKTWEAIDYGLLPSLDISSTTGVGASASISSNKQRGEYPLYTSSTKELQPSASISSIKKIGEYLICGHPDGIFRSSDRGKTWKIVHSGVDEKVFKIYVSGGVLYAVARDLGC